MAGEGSPHHSVDMLATMSADGSRVRTVLTDTRYHNHIEHVNGLRQASDVLGQVGATPVLTLLRDGLQHKGITDALLRTDVIFEEKGTVLSEVQWGHTRNEDQPLEGSHTAVGIEAIGATKEVIIHGQELELLTEDQWRNPTILLDALKTAVKKTRKSHIYS